MMLSLVFIYSHIGGVGVLASSDVDRGFKLTLDQTKDDKSWYFLLLC